MDGGHSRMNWFIRFEKLFVGDMEWNEMEWNTRLGLTASLLAGRTATFWSRARGKRQGTET